MLSVGFEEGEVETSLLTNTDFSTSALSALSVGIGEKYETQADKYLKIYFIDAELILKISLK
jgi:hypothetical protein